MLRLLISAALVCAGASAASGAAAKDPWPEGGRIDVFLCEGSARACEEGAATPEERRSIQAVLEADPRLAEVTYTSPEQALADQRASGEAKRSNGPPDEFPELQLSDMSGFFNARVLRSEDLAAVEAGYSGFPGAWLVSVSPWSYWDDKSDTLVTMCGEPGELAQFVCADRGAATEAERQAVEDVLTGIEGAVVYPQSPAFQAWTELRMSARLSLDESLVEGVYVDTFLADLPAVPDAALLDRLIGMPGVYRVDHFPPS